MRALDLNLASRPYRNDTLLVAVYLLVLFALLGWGAGASWLYRARVEREAGLQEDLRSMRVGIEGFEKDVVDYNLRIAELPLEQMKERGDFAREILERKRFSWTRLFNDLEQDVVPCNVKLLSIHPRYVADHMLIDVRGTSREGPEGYFEFLDKVQRNAHFPWVYPRGMRRAGRGVQDVTFDLSFHYFPEPGRVLPPEVLAQLEAAVRQVEKDEDEAGDDEGARAALEAGDFGDGADAAAEKPPVETPAPVQAQAPAPRPQTPPVARPQAPGARRQPPGATGRRAAGTRPRQGRDARGGSRTPVPEGARPGPDRRGDGGFAGQVIGGRQVPPPSPEDAPEEAEDSAADAADEATDRAREEPPPADEGDDETVESPPPPDSLPRAPAPRRAPDPDESDDEPEPDDEGDDGGQP